MYNDPSAGHRLRHDTADPDVWGAEMLGFLRDHDEPFERWRHEQLRRLDEDYRAFRRERFAEDFGRWRAEREQRTGRIEEPRQPAIAMPLGSSDMPPGGGTITPDADASRHRAEVQRFHETQAAAEAIARR